METGKPIDEKIENKTNNCIRIVNWHIFSQNSDTAWTNLIPFFHFTTVKIAESHVLPLHVVRIQTIYLALFRWSILNFNKQKVDLDIPKNF